MAQSPNLDPPPMPKGWKMDLIRTEPDPDEIVPCIVSRKVEVKSSQWLWHWQLASMTHETLMRLKRNQDIDPGYISWHGEPCDIQQSLQGCPDFDLVDKLGELFDVQVVQCFDTEVITKTRGFLRDPEEVTAEVKKRIR